MSSETVKHDNAVIEAQQAANAHLNNVGLATYTEMKNALKQALDALYVSSPEWVEPNSYETYRLALAECWRVLDKGKV